MARAQGIREFLRDMRNVRNAWRRLVRKWIFAYSFNAGMIIISAALLGVSIARNRAEATAVQALCIAINIWGLQMSRVGLREARAHLRSLVPTLLAVRHGLKEYRKLERAMLSGQIALAVIRSSDDSARE